ncbi:MAG: phosphatase PAP2 family protein [Marmoricola sp.]
MNRARTTAAAGSSAAAAAAVVGLADAARENEGPARLDPGLANHVDHWRSGPLTLLAHTLTFVGSEVVVTLAATVLMVVLLRRRWYAETAAVGVGMVGSAAMIVGIKHLVMRARPPAVDRLGPVDHSFSFPSGHTLNSAIFLGLLVLTFGWWLTPRPRRWIVAVALSLAIGIGLSRLYLGYHWGTDVLASWLLAAAWLAVVAAMMPLLRRVADLVFRRESGALRDPDQQNGPPTGGRRDRRDVPWSTTSPSGS